MKDPVFQIIQTLLANSPEASYKRLNPALRCALGDCIAAGLPFKRDTFTRIYNELRGGWWFGDGAGSAMGEHYYSKACSVNHTPACLSFEQFAGRPGVLWEEHSKTPARLHVGSEFSWGGYYVTVTSMRADSLVACTYKGHRREVNGIQVGATVGDYDAPYLITSANKDGAATVLRVIKATKVSDNRDVARRFVIPYSEITEFRRTEARRVAALVAKIEECNPAKDGKKIQREVNRQAFRHFQLEIVNGAFQKRVKDIAESKAKKKQAADDRRRQREVEEMIRTEPQRVEAWRNGMNGAWLNCRGTYLRVRGDLVECSNGNSVSKAAAVRVLPIVLDRRHREGTLNLPIDGHTIDSVGENGVRIGCTHVPWVEVEYLAKAITALKA